MAASAQSVPIHVGIDQTMNKNQVSKNQTKKRIITYLMITFFMSSIFYFLIISIGVGSSEFRPYAIGLMWSPGIAALLTIKMYKGNASELGWNWGRTRFQLLSYCIPLAYSLLTYAIVWITGLGGFYNVEFVNSFAASFGWSDLSPHLSILLYFLLIGIIGMVDFSAYALGEEIGWRGFLVPELNKITSYTKTSIITGIIWSLWHYPLIIFSNYNGGTPFWYSLICFTVMIISSCFIYTWMRMKSNSLWTGVFLHGSHNLFIQRIFTPLTSDTGNTEFFIDEFGAGLAIASFIFGFIFWTKRDQLNRQSV